MTSGSPENGEMSLEGAGSKRAAIADPAIIDEIGHNHVADKAADFLPQFPTKDGATADVSAKRRSKKRRKVCDTCKSRKIRCDGGTPCGSCKRDMYEVSYKCEYSERRGRTVIRATSPPPFQHNKRALSHSPDSQFFNIDSESAKDGESVFWDLPTDVKPELYRYASLGAAEIRLLRISPGNSSDPLYCSLKAIALDRIKSSVLEFQALSYSWGGDNQGDYVCIQNISPFASNKGTDDVVGQSEYRPFKVRRNLYAALKRVREENENTWVWVDAICIDQKNKHEKSLQIPRMPDIYSNAWNVIVWLGEDDPRQNRLDMKTKAALRLIPKLLNLKSLDAMLGSEDIDEDVMRSWVYFGDILQLPWFTRRWIIQEIACARRLSLRIGSNVFSWIDFADAAELFLDRFDRICDLYSRSKLAKRAPDALRGVGAAGARAVLELSRNVFRKSHDSQTFTRLMDLESLILATTKFGVTDSRDVVYALLHLANDIDYKGQITTALTGKPLTFAADYSKNPVELFMEFVEYCIAKSNSFDVICRSWLPLSVARQLGSRFGSTKVPSWVGVASCGQQVGDLRLSLGFRRDDLVGKPRGPLYSASHHMELEWQRIAYVLKVDGFILGKVQDTSARIIEGTIPEDCLQLLGWEGHFDAGLPDKLWRTLVANRTSEGRMVPGWYRRACALALTKLTSEGDLNIAKLVADLSQPSTLIEYLKRVQDVTRNRKFFRCSPGASIDGNEQGEDILEAAQQGKQDGNSCIIGLGPRDMVDGDLVCILFGCSVPVILRPLPERWETDRLHMMLVDAAYVHDYMEGVLFAGLTKDEVHRRSTTFRLL